MCNLNVRECWKSRTSGRERARNRHIQTEMFNEIIENGFEGNWIWRIVWLKLSPRVAHVISRRVLETIQYYGHSTANALGSRINTPAILKCVMQVHNYKPFDAWSSSLSLSAGSLLLVFVRLHRCWLLSMPVNSTCMLETSSMCVIIYST